MTARAALYCGGALVAAGVVILGLRVAIVALAAWLDRRRRRQESAPDQFPAVHLPADGDQPELICLPGGRNGRPVCRRPYQGRN